MLSMDISMGKCVFMLMVMSVLTEPATSFRSSVCQLDFVTLLHDLNSQCPITDPFSSSPIQVFLSFSLFWLID